MQLNLLSVMEEEETNKEQELNETRHSDTKLKYESVISLPLHHHHLVVVRRDSSSLTHVGPSLFTLARGNRDTTIKKTKQNQTKNR